MKKPFGNIDGKDNYLFSLTNGKITVEFVSYAGSIRSFIVPDKNGNPVDIALGYKTGEEYGMNGGSFGALVGRYANRIENGQFVLNGKTYQLDINSAGNTIHGGKKGLNKRVWEGSEEDGKVIFTYFSPDGEEKFPANLDVRVEYSLTEDNGLKIDYFATADADTIVNFTNHVYFNLNGEGSGNVFDTLIKIDSDYITPLGKNFVPNNTFRAVYGTPFDFNEFKAIGKDFNEKDDQLEISGGYDINYVLKGEGLRKIAEAKSEKTGITLETYTDQKGVQFYSGNNIKDVEGKSGTYHRFDGFCLETQNYPNAINCSNFPSPILKKGETYRHTTIYKIVSDGLKK